MKDHGHRVAHSGTPEPEFRDGFDPHAFLIGRPPVGEFIGFMTGQAGGELGEDVGQLMSEWRHANDRVKYLEAAEPDFADQAVLEDLPDELDGLAKSIAEDPVFKRSFGLVPSDIRMIELDRLVVYQKMINLRYVRHLQDSIGANPSPISVFDLCLPRTRETPPVRLQRTAANCYVFVSPSNDLRFTEPILLKSQNVIGYVPHGPVAGVVGLVVGFSSNLLQAVYAEGRLVLHNGSNRAYALRELGVTHVPCVVQRVSRREELEMVGSADVQRTPDAFLKAPRPPVLKDYFDPELRKVIQVPGKDRQVRITFGVEPMDVPSGR